MTPIYTEAVRRGACTLLLCFSFGASGAQTLAERELIDQWGYPDSLASHSGQTVMVLVVDVRRLGTIQRWQEELGARFPELRWLRIGDLDEPGPVDLARVRDTLQRRVPRGAAVLVDHERLWASSLDLDTRQPNLLLYASDGQLAGRWHGRWSDTLGDEVSLAVATLMALR
ncbi:MAG: hypothetical protein JJT85_02650 [Chromatiales bacterium]|nr:hypothetical protein [Chromatiales bacterium]